MSCRINLRPHFSVRVAQFLIGMLIAITLAGLILTGTAQREPLVLLFLLAVVTGIEKTGTA
jgi:hypothetical protein